MTLSTVLYKEIVAKKYAYRIYNINQCISFHNFFLKVYIRQINNRNKDLVLNHFISYINRKIYAIKFLV